MISQPFTPLATRLACFSLRSQVCSAVIGFDPQNQQEPRRLNCCSVESPSPPPPPHNEAVNEALSPSRKFVFTQLLPNGHVSVLLFCLCISWLKNCHHHVFEQCDFGAGFLEAICLYSIVNWVRAYVSHALGTRVRHTRTGYARASHSQHVPSSITCSLIDLSGPSSRLKGPN